MVTRDVFSAIPSRIWVKLRLQRMGKAAHSNSENGKRRVRETEIIKRAGRKKHERLFESERTDLKEWAKGYAVSERHGVKVMERWFNSLCKVLLLCSKWGQRKIICYHFLYNISNLKNKKYDLTSLQNSNIWKQKKQLGACSIVSIVFTASGNHTKLCEEEVLICLQRKLWYE